MSDPSGAPAVRRRVVSFGDIANDVVALPKTGIRPDTDTTSTIRPHPGGSAANTAAWLGSLGAAVDFVGSVGIYDHDYHAEQLSKFGVIPHLGVAPGLPTSTIVIIVEGSHRTMLTERGANRALDAAQLTDDLLAEAAVLHLTGYNLMDGPRAHGMRELIDRAHARGVTVSLNPGSAGFIDDYGPQEFATAIDRADIIFANVAEGALLTGQTVPERIVQKLADRHGTAVLTHSSDNVLVGVRGQRPVTLPVIEAKLVDPTGAGDAMAAGFLHSWLDDRDPVRAAAAGVVVAARAVMVMGGRPVI